MPETFPGWKASIFALLNLLVPGLGHLALGRKGRAFAFLGIVSGMFMLGLMLEGALFSFTGSNLLFRLAAVGQAGSGLLFLLGRLLDWGPLSAARAASQMFGYGNACLVTAGLMNMLLMMDTYDIAVGRKP